MARNTTSPRATGLFRARNLAVVGLLLATLLSAYLAVSLLTRVTPALFPGQTLSIPGVKKLPDPVSVAAPKPEQSSFTDPITLLLVGLDRRPGEWDYAAMNADLISVASIDPQTKEVRMLSFPRDLLIEVNTGEGVVQDRINASFAIGAEPRESIADGARQLQRDLSWNFDIAIDYWIVVDFEGMERLIDAMGGIDLYIPDDLAVPLWWYSNDDVTHVQVEFPAGWQHLDGYHAVAFARHRETDDDFHRMRRQQLVAQAAVSQVVSRRLLTNGPNLIDAFNRTVHTNLSKAQIAGLAPLARQSSGHLEAYSLADPVGERPTVSDVMLPSGAWVLTWDPINVEHFIRLALPGQRPFDEFDEFGENGNGEPEEAGDGSSESEESDSEPGVSTGGQSAHP